MYFDNIQYYINHIDKFDTLPDSSQYPKKHQLVANSEQMNAYDYMELNYLYTLVTYM